MTQMESTVKEIQKSYWSLCKTRLDRLKLHHKYAYYLLLKCSMYINKILTFEPNKLHSRS